MDFNVTNFIQELTLVQLVVALVIFEGLEVISGLINAWRNKKPIKSAITRESIAKKFDSWKYIFALSGLFMYVGAEDLAEALLGFVLLPELISIIQNIKESYKVSNYEL